MSETNTSASASATAFEPVVVHIGGGGGSGEACGGASEGIEDAKLADKTTLKSGYRYARPQILLECDNGYKTMIDEFNKLMTIEFLSTIDVDNGEPTANLMAFEKWFYGAMMKVCKIKISAKKHLSPWQMVLESYRIRERTYEKPTYSVEECFKYWSSDVADPEMKMDKDFNIIEMKVKQITDMNFAGLFTEDAYRRISNYCTDAPDMYGISAYNIMNFPKALEFVLGQFSRIISWHSKSTETVGDSCYVDFDGKLSSDWTRGVLFFKYKKGAVSDPVNFRPIVSQPIVVRMFHKALGRYMYDYMISREYLDKSLQKGFSRDSDGIFENTIHVQKMIKVASDESRNLFCCMLDVKHAYNSISYPLMKYALEKYGFQADLIDYIMNFYYNVQMKFLHNGKICEEEFPWQKGLLQGDNLANVLFLICFNTILSRIENTYGGLGFSIKKNVGTEALPLYKTASCLQLAYVDDVLIFTENFTSLQVVVEMFNMYLVQIGLELNSEKSKWAQLCYAGKEESNVLAVAGNIIFPLEKGETFRYLGTEMSFYGDESITLDKYVKWIKEQLMLIDSMTIVSCGITDSWYKSSDPLPNSWKYKLYTTFVYRRTQWDFVRTIWSKDSVSAIEEIEKIYIMKWKNKKGTWYCNYLFDTRMKRCKMMRELRCLNSTHSMMRLFTACTYSYNERSKITKRMEQLTELTKTLDDEYKTCCITDYDEMETL